MCGHAVTHTQGVNEPPVISQLVHYMTADIANPCTTCTKPTRPVDRLQDPPDQLEPLWIVASTKVKRETADKDCQAHKHIDNETSQVMMSKDEPP